MINKLFTILFFTSFCMIGNAELNTKNPSLPTRCITLAKGKKTIFIHGTRLPLITTFSLQKNLPQGLYPLSSNPSSVFKRIANTLHTSDPEEFGLHSFYFYAWSGALDFHQRKQAAKELFDLIADHTDPLTIIGHSHGCSIALYLAEIAQKENKVLNIDKLVLLAPPVQTATAHYVGAPIFKRVYSFYSTADIMQIIDPQGLYYECKKANGGRKTALFSKRQFPEGSNVLQGRILFNFQSPGHRTFIHTRFLKQLPTLIKLLEHQDKHHNERNSIINIPSHPDLPYPVKKFELAHSYVPRTVRRSRKVPSRLQRFYA